MPSTPRSSAPAVSAPAHAATEGEAAPPGWIALATSGPVVRRSLVFFFGVGGLLVAINHGDAIARGDIDGVRLGKMLLTPLVPYLVSTYSSVSAIREHHRRPPSSMRGAGTGDGPALG